MHLKTWWFYHQVFFVKKNDILIILLKKVLILYFRYIIWFHTKTKQMNMLVVLVQATLTISAISFTENVEKILQDDVIYIAEADYSNQNNTVVQSPINLEFSEFAVTSLMEDETRNQKEVKIYAGLFEAFKPINPVPYLSLPRVDGAL